MEFVGRRILAIGIGMLVLVSGVIVYSMMPTPLLIPAKTQYHYERNLTSTDPRTTLVRLFEVADSEILISFINDPELLYSVDIEFSEPMSHWEDFTWLDAHQPPANLDEFNFIGINTGALINGHIMLPDLSDVPVKSINLTLGISSSYEIQVKGKNMTTTVRYDNGARLNESELQYHDLANEGGDVFIYMASDVNLTSCSVDIDISGVNRAFLDIRNPEPLGGIIDVHGGVLDGVQLLGWVQGGYTGNWRFSRTTTEEIDIDVYAESTSINLLTQS